MTSNKRTHGVGTPSHLQVTADLHKRIHDAQTQQEAKQARHARRLVGALPIDELPDGDDRAALADAVARGEVEDIYQPCAADYHNVTIPGLPAWVDPRVTVVTWAQWRREGRDIPATLLANARARGDG